MNLLVQTIVTPSLLYPHLHCTHDIVITCLNQQKINKMDIYQRRTELEYLEIEKNLKRINKW